MRLDIGLEKSECLYFWVLAQKDFGHPKIRPHPPCFLPSVPVETKTELSRRIFGWRTVLTAIVARI